MTKVDRGIIEGTCNLHPEALKKFICVEELGELSQAISKVMRDKLSDKPVDAGHTVNEVEEIADVMLCLKMIQYYDHISDAQIQLWIDYKQNRQMIRDYHTLCDNYEGRDSLDNLGEYANRCKEAFDEDKFHEE